MFILTKQILVSLCAGRAGYLFIVQLNSKEIIRRVNKLVCMPWEEAGPEVPRYCPLVARPRFWGAREGSPVSQSGCASAPAVPLFQASVTCCWWRPCDVALSNNPCTQLCLCSHHKSVRSWRSLGGNEPLSIERWLVVDLSMAKKPHASEDRAFWINIQFGGVGRNPASTCQN